MKTPHISLRVPNKTFDRWKATCQKHDTNVSEQIRLLMNAWCDIDEEAESLKELVESKVDIEKIRKKYGID